MGRRKKTNFEESLVINMHTYTMYLQRLTELSMSMFDWQGLPDTVDARYLEMSEFTNGATVFFNEPDVGYLCLDVIQQSNFDVYGNPISRRAYSKYNNFQRELTNENSVIIWNNYLRTNSALVVKNFAKRLYNLDRIIDVNANAQKTPIMILASDKQRLTMLNLYKEYDGNSPVIFGDSNLDLSKITCVKTDAPYVADKIYQLKQNIWNEALTYLGIPNVSYQKKERLITDEVLRGQGGTIASRNSRLNARKEACEKINDMFGLDINVEYRDINDMETEMPSNQVEEGDIFE